VSFTLPEHFKFASMPTVMPLLAVPDLILGPAFLEDGNRTLSVYVSFNGRIEPLQGIRVTDVFVFYDGIGIPFEYRGSITGAIDLTEAHDPTAVIDSGTVSAALYAGTVLDDANYTWFDESAGGGGFADFVSLEAAHDAWVGTTDDVVDFEMLTAGEKVAEQYLGSHGVFFSGADGGNYNDLTGVQIEDGPYVEQVTGYDGSYQPDGTNVSLRFQNTSVNPDAPFTIEFAGAQCKVAALIACGSQGSDHSFTITVSDGSGNALDTKVSHAQLWETDPTGQNCETLFAVESQIPNIRSISILNNSTMEFADALIADTIEFETCIGVTPGDVNFDGIVGFDDLLAVLSNWGPCQGLCSEDSDGSGDVGFGDLLDVLSNWT
jgi:hypothetical protein